MELKFHFFPAAFPDETLHSVLSRYARLCGGSRKSAFTGELAAVSFTQNVAFPSRLADLAESLPQGTHLSVARIIGLHTVLPYYAPFLTHDQVQQAQAMMAVDGKGLMLKLGVNASRIESASRVRFCPVCLDEDIAQGGAAYWHRTHQLPGVLVCPHHCQLLKIVDPGWYSRNARQLNLPDDDEVQAHSVQLDVAQEYLPRLHQVSVNSQQLLSSDLGPLPATVLQSYLLQGAAALDLACGETLRLDLCRLAAHMNSFFDELPLAAEYSILRDASPGSPATWVTKLLRRPRGTHHPLKYILLASALKVGLVSIPNTGALLLPEEERALPIEVRSSLVGASDPRIEELHGLPAAVWKLALAGHDALRIADSLNVSVVYVYRAIRAVEGGPSAWRDARFLSERRQRRTAFEDAYRRLHAHHCRDYAWLYRCDRVWLADCVAKHGNAHRGRAYSAGVLAILDPELAEQIKCCAQRLRAGSGKPVRISRTRIGRELNALSRFEKQLAKLPLCARALEQECESAEQFHRRRLQWAEAKLVSEQRNVTRSALYRTACIRPRM